MSVLGDEAVTNWDGRTRDGSTLQRPPPLITILRAPLFVLSSSRTSRPDSAAKMAAIVPAAPAPTTTTGWLVPATQPNVGIVRAIE